MPIAAARHQDAHYHPGWNRARASQVGMLLFLAALAMLFLAGLLGYGLIRLRAVDRVPLHTLALPLGVWISTPLMLAAGICFESAIRAVRQEQVARFRTCLITAVALVVGFLVVQIPTLLQLLGAHQRVRASGLGLYGLTFVLILLHAVHVAGGLVPLGVVLRNGLRRRYDHEHWWPIRLVALYWHFLDGVWLVMLAVLVGLG